MQPTPARVDPRVYQSVVLAALLAWGETRLGFGLGPRWIAATLGAALLTQWSCARLYHWPRSPAFDPWSALISGLSLCLLLRTNHLALMVAAAAIAIASKFLLRVGDRHLWNPTNLAIAVMLGSGLGWVSPGQWGSAAYFGLLVAGAGSFVVVRAARLDVAAAFLASWAALLFGRAIHLGDPLAIPLRQLRSGALLVFAFYMISDPKTTPRSRAARVAFAALVASGAFVVQFVLYRQDGLLWSLALCAPAAALLDHVRSRFFAAKGETHEPTALPARLLARLPLPRPARAGARVLRLLRRQGRERPLQPQLARRPGA
jgi:Na+-translocating ferredoxin:NAD+ oxidoreductase RnfD subunit